MFNVYFSSVKDIAYFNMLNSKYTHKRIIWLYESFTNSRNVYIFSYFCPLPFPQQLNQITIIETLNLRRYPPLNSH